MRGRKFWGHIIGSVLLAGWIGGNVVFGVGEASSPTKPSAVTSPSPSLRARTPKLQSSIPALDRYFKNVRVGPGRFSMNLRLRSRYEHLGNFTIRQYGTESDDVLLWRMRWGLGYQLPSSLQAYVEFQDSRYTLSRINIGEFGKKSSYYDAFDLHQAYLEWDRIGNLPVGLKIGRQCLQYGGRRLFSPGQWGNVGRFWWDAVRLRYDDSAATVDLIYGQRVFTEPHRWDWNHYPWHMGLVYVHTKHLPIPLDLFYTIKNDYSKHRGETGRTGDETRHTFGIYSAKPPGQGWDYGLFLAGQLGTWAHDTIRAYGGMFQIGYTFPTAWKPRIGFEFSYGSGDSNPHDRVRETYDGIFGALDAPYGWMNVVHIQNLQDYVLHLSAHPLSTVDCSAEFHLFRLFDSHDAWYWPSGKRVHWDPTGASGSQLGKEIDLLARWRPRKDLELFAGWAYFFRDLDAPDIRDLSDHADWAFLQLSWSY